MEFTLRINSINSKTLAGYRQEIILCSNALLCRVSFMSTPAIMVVRPTILMSSYDGRRSAYRVHIVSACPPNVFRFLNAKNCHCLSLSVLIALSKTAHRSRSTCSPDLGFLSGDGLTLCSQVSSVLTRIVGSALPMSSRLRSFLCGWEDTYGNTKLIQTMCMQKRFTSKSCVIGSGRLQFLKLGVSLSADNFAAMILGVECSCLRTRDLA